MDFSVNTNPLGPPKFLDHVVRKCLDDGVLLYYPDYEYASLRQYIAEFYGCDVDSIIATNGANEAINLVLTALRRDIVVIEPSYGEYEDVARAINVNYSYILYRVGDGEYHLNLSDLDVFCRDPSKLIVITNPNNPTGNYVSRDKLMKYACECSSTFLIDESYVELCDECPYELNTSIPENVVIVRSLGKVLSLPGLRFGFLFSPNERLINMVNALRQPWNVNSLAECVISDILSRPDVFREFIDTSRRYISRERARVMGKLSGLGVKVFKSSTNFLLLNLGVNAVRVIDGLESRGIFIRRCHSFKGLGEEYIRISIRRPEDNDVLLSALEGILGGP